jgi:biopolymer transport protein ExbB/TolQ
MIQQVKKAKTIDELRSIAALNTHTIGGYLVVKELASLKQILEVKDNRFSLTHEDYLMLCDRTDQTINEILYYQESYLSILSTSAAAAPLLGLLGTIWGLVHSFLNISQTQQADIVTIAPGIAEALITTLAGLLVALPSLVMFHYLHGQVRHLEQKLYLLADRVHDTMRLAFMKQ